MLMDEMNFIDKKYIENLKILILHILSILQENICAFVNITFIINQKIEISWIFFAWK